MKVLRVFKGDLFVDRCKNRAKWSSRTVEGTSPRKRSTDLGELKYQSLFELLMSVVFDNFVFQQFNVVFNFVESVSIGDRCRLLM